MSHQTRSFTVDSSFRVAQGLALGHSAVAGAFDGLREFQRQRDLADLGAVEAVARELHRVRRLLAAAQAETAAARAEVATLERAVDGERARAGRAEANLARLVEAVRDGRIRAQ